MAKWRGLRGEDLDLALDGGVVIVCSRTKQTVAFCAVAGVDENEEESE
jgi:hypothetical protein